MTTKHRGENTGSHPLVSITAEPPLGLVLKPIVYLTSLVVAIVIATVTGLGWLQQEVRKQIDPVAADVRLLRVDVRAIKADIDAMRSTRLTSR